MTNRATARATTPRRRPAVPLALLLALSALAAGAGCSAGSPSEPPPAGEVTAAAAAASPTPTASPSPKATVTPVSPSPPTPTPPAATASGTTVPLTPEVTAKLDEAVQRVLTQASVPGVIVNVSTPQGEYLKAFGVSERVPGTAMVTGLNMRVGSLTKTFTVTGVLRLVDQGRVGLDDPVGKYLTGVPNGGTITLRQLSDMRSGLFSYTQDEDFVRTLQADPQRAFTPDQLLAYAFRHPVNFAPDAEFEYSNTNTVLLGKVIEKVAGQPLGDFLKKEVFQPADLDRTVFPTDNAFPQPHARGYTDQTADGTITDATDWNPSWGWAAGAAISDQADMKKWAKALATGSLLKPETQAQRLEPQPSKVPGTWYGLGVFYNHGWIGHNGSLPGYQSVAVYLPSAQASLVVLLNTDVEYRGSAPSTLFAKAITEVVSPGNVYDLPAVPAEADDPGTEEPSASPSVKTSSTVKPPEESA
ncbi:serine hydrolase domain-containing protein [Kitasatospora sp. NPDC057500]|uniref:serine hydrolase domain-containing protein n=1 Tax=Kitasatospora sp. NPDC057500 TaxID=3346151 RepID=UPI0036BC8271